MSGFFSWFKEEQDKLKAPQASAKGKPVLYGEEYDAASAAFYKARAAYEAATAQARRALHKSLSNKDIEKSINPEYKLHTEVHGDYIQLHVPGSPVIHAPTVTEIRYFKCTFSFGLKSEYEVYVWRDASDDAQRLRERAEEISAVTKMLREKPVEDTFYIDEDAPKVAGLYRIVIDNLSVEVDFIVHPGQLPVALHTLLTVIKQVCGNDVHIVDMDKQALDLARSFRP